MNNLWDLFKDYKSHDKGRKLMITMMKYVLSDVLSHKKIETKDVNENS